MSAVPPIEPNAADESVEFIAADGWRLSGILRRRDEGFGGVGFGVVLVHAPHHERDAYVYGLALPDVLAAHGIASIRFDIRGRGASRSPRPWAQLTPLERRAVALDVSAAVAVLRARTGSQSGELGVVAEQDVVAAALATAVAEPDIGALVLLSPRFGRTGLRRPVGRAVPTCALVSPEDRRALRDAVAAYLAGPAEESELHVLPGLGLGTTMFMARAFEEPGEVPLEVIIAEWLHRVLSARTLRRIEYTQSRRRD